MAANAPAESVDAKLMVATGHGDCQLLKDQLNKEDATTMVAPMATSNKASAAKPSPPRMNPLLLAAACEGNREELKFLLSRNCTHGSLAMPRSSDDIEEGASMPAEPAASRLEGVTVEGDTVLHVVAANGDEANFLECATFVLDMAGHLLFARNNNGDTPVHSAARAKKSKMVTHLIGAVREHKIVIDLLRVVNDRRETVLHGAVRNGDNDLVVELLRADSELARFPDEGSSPMYLAILLEEESIAQTLHEKSKDNDLSYSGPNGQNALHAAVLRGKVLTKTLLGWKKDLAAQKDEKGSTPLHFAAGLQWQRRKGSVCSQVFEAYPAILYQPDNDGLCPIHVAASAGAWDTIAMFVDKCRRSAGLRDAKGRTFLHVAVDQRQDKIVGYACKNRSLTWILNMQDNDGNTALHLAVQNANLDMFRALFGNRQVNLNLTNAEGQTPLDIARYKIRPSFNDDTNFESWICRALTIVGAKSGVLRQDHFIENYENIYRVKSDYEAKELEMVKDSTQSQSIGSVLIATVTFGATFALPGGYKSDDHTNGGTPTLAGSWTFLVFMMANALAFISSSIATVGFMYAGSAMLNLVRRRTYFYTTMAFMHTSIIALTAAFALGVYTVLAPVAQKTAIAICIMSPLVVLYNFADFWLNLALFVKPFYIRMGPIWTLRTYTLLVGSNMLKGQYLLKPILSVIWLCIFIFLWVAYRKPSPISMSASPAPAPAPLA